MGDEYHHWVESEDGYTLLYDDEGFLTLALPDKDGDLQPSKLRFRNEMDRDFDLKRELQRVPKHIPFSPRQLDEVHARRVRAMERRRIITPDKPVVGTRKFLMVLMQFPDKAFKHTQAEFDALMNEIGYTTDGNQGSVRDFYRENSFGQLDLVTDVVGVFTAQHNLAYYGNNKDGNPRSLAREALAAAAQQVNLSDYDTDGDGFIDGLHIVFAGYGEEAGGGDDCIWSHEATTSGIFATQGNIKMNAYSCTPELRGGSGSGMSFIGVICHEIGHALGTSDFYDTNYGQGGLYAGTGEWDVMGDGNWNGYGSCPAHFNPYTKIYDYKWSDVQDGNRAVCAKFTAKTKGDFLRINTSTEGEYFLLEYRSQKGFDRSIPGHGLMVWRATNDLSGRNANTINAYHKQQFYPLAANAPEAIPNSTPSSYGTTNSSSTPFPGTNSVTELTDETTPSMRSWEGEATEFPLTNITENWLDEYVEFDISGGDYGTAYGLGVTDAELTTLTVTWKVPQPNMKVMLLCNTEDAFGTPEGQMYDVGEQLTDGGQVIYVGTASEFLHTGLKEHTNYYFRICTWVAETNSWAVSGTRMGRTKTGVITTFPFEDDFESQKIDDAYEEEIIFGSVNHWSVGHTIDNGVAQTTDWVLKFEPVESFCHQQSRFLFPVMNLSNTNCALLSFDYRNWVQFAQVMYRTSLSSDWILLSELDNHYQTVNPMETNGNQLLMNSESHISFLLPDLSEEYQISIVADFSPRGKTLSSLEVMTIDNFQVRTDIDMFVETLDITALGTTFANVGFRVIPGTVTPDAVGVAYSTDLTTWTKVPATSGICHLEGLSRNTNYYYRAFADASGTTYYADTKLFTTLSFDYGSGTKEDPILISSISDWDLLRTTVANGNDCKGCFFALTSNISLETNNYISNTFSGSLDGQGNTLTTSKTGLVSYFIEILGAEGEIKNLKLTTGPLVETNYGCIHQCEVDFNQSSIVSSINSHGFIAGRNYNIVYDCHVKALSVHIEEQTWFGGVCGMNSKLVSQCTFEGNLSTNNYAALGGIVGVNYYNDTNYGLVNYCVNKGNISVRKSSTGHASFTDLGGICGSSYGLVDQCVNIGNIYTASGSDENDNSNSAGGIVGNMEHSQSSVTNCYNVGVVNTAFLLDHKSNSAGGIAGSAYLASINNCFSVGTIQSQTSIFRYNHAIVGHNNQTKVENCYFIGDLSDDFSLRMTQDDIADISFVNELNKNAGGNIWKIGTTHPELILESEDCSMTLYPQMDCTTHSVALTGLILGSLTGDCGLEWKAVGDEQWNRICVLSGNAFQTQLVGLKAATMYECRLFAICDSGEKYTGSILFATNFENSGSYDDPILLPSLDALKVFRQTVLQGNQYGNQFVRLITDLDLHGDEGELWEPITEGTNGGFAGDFDGNGHIIRNMKIVSSDYAIGFFGVTQKCHIHDLTIMDGEIVCKTSSSDNGYLGGVGGIVGTNNFYRKDGRPLVERCSFTGTISGGNRIGGIVGGAGDNEIKDCYVIASLNYPGTDEAIIGGIAGMGNVTNCYFVGSMDAPSASSKSLYPILSMLKDGSDTYVVTNSYYRFTNTIYPTTRGVKLYEYEMKDGTLLSKFSDEVWQADNTVTPINDGYPILRSQAVPHIWTLEAKIVGGNSLKLKGQFYGAEKNYAVRGFEYSRKQDRTDAMQVIATSANEFSAEIPFTEGTYLAYRAFARENESTTVYGEWLEFEGGEAEEYVIGDVNNDGKINIGDYTALVSTILGTSNFELKYADINENGMADVGDLTALVNMILSEGASTSTYSQAIGWEEPHEANSLGVVPFTLCVGQEVLITLHMNNEALISALQTDLVLPQGITLEDVTLADGRTTERAHNMLTFQRLNDGSYRILCASTGNRNFNGHEGAVLKLRVKADGYVATGEHELRLTHSVLSTNESVTFEPTDVTTKVTIGTATGIGKLNEGDFATGNRRYDLQGRPAKTENSTQNGIFIENGKKHIIK